VCPAVDGAAPGRVLQFLDFRERLLVGFGVSEGSAPWVVGIAGRVFAEDEADLVLDVLFLGTEGGFGDVFDGEFGFAGAGRGLRDGVDAFFDFGEGELLFQQLLVLALQVGCQGLHAVRI
jgi:hypothetical protein